MSYRVEKIGDFIEVHIDGPTNEWEILKVLKAVHRLAPRKDISDIWFLSEESVVPWHAFATIVKGIAKLLAPGAMRSRSAIVVADEFQKGEAEMYQREAACLPFETGVFMSRDAAENWLRS